MVIRNARVLTPDGFVAPGAVAFEDDRIVAVGPQEAVPVRPGAELLDAGGMVLAPGFVDIHTHGAAGYDFCDEEPEAFNTICRYHAGGGTTSVLATTCSLPRTRLLATVMRIVQAVGTDTGGARIIGVHVEGPFFVVDWRGCHLPEYLRPPSDDEVDDLLQHAPSIANITLSPEIEGGLRTIERFAQAGITVSCGHSDAPAHLLIEAIARGVRHSTHMYCAMGSIHREGPHRLPGVVETVLARDDITTELIADGIHVPPLMMALTVRAKGPERVCLVSDSMRGAGMPDGDYTFGPRDGKMCFVRGGISIMPENTGFASSVIRLNDAVRVMVQQVGVDLATALRMASQVPARIIGCDHRKGQLAPGMDADLVLLDDNFNVVRTVVAGRTVHCA